MKRFLTMAVPVGVFTYIVGWWSGYRTAIHEWKKPEPDDVMQSRVYTAHPILPMSEEDRADFAEWLTTPPPPAPAPDTSSYKMESIREGWPRHFR